MGSFFFWALSRFFFFFFFKVQFFCLPISSSIKKDLKNRKIKRRGMEWFAFGGWKRGRFELFWCVSVVAMFGLQESFFLPFLKDQ